jgi:peptidoglycan/LPS O-acetylase OafA/YrhL
MLGTLRFVLAVLVVFNHLWLPTANKLGAHAVTSFYIVSGFLMAKIIQEVYGLSARGFGHYILNRFLRIFPPYATFLGISVILLVLFENTFGQTYSNMKLPSSWDSWFSNVTLINLTWAPEIVIPPAWSLSVEFFFYISMGLLLARNRMIATVWFLASVGLTIGLIVSDAKFSTRYSPTYAASLYFSIGAMIYFNWDRIKRLGLHLGGFALLVPLFCAFPLLVEYFGFDPHMEGYYGATLLFIVIFISSMTIRVQRWRRADKLLGDMAYFIFIGHIMSAGIVRIIFPNAVTPYGFIFLLMSLILCIALSYLFLTVVQRRLDSLRDRVRTDSHDSVLVSNIRP